MVQLLRMLLVLKSQTLDIELLKYVDPSAIINTITRLFPYSHSQFDRHQHCEKLSQFSPLLDGTEKITLCML